MPVGPHIFSHLEDALAECFEFHNQLDAFVLRTGLSRDRLAAARQRAEERKGRWSSAPKRFVAQEILEELRTGSADDDRFIASLVTAFCRTTFSSAKPTGLEAIEALKRARDDDGRIAAEQQAARQRELEEIQRQKDRTGEAKAAIREAFRQRLLTLSTMPDAHQRGYALETFLNEFMAHEGLSPRGSFKNTGEQIDGAFSWSSRTHLVEAKWVKDGVDGKEFGAFDYKIGGKTADTRGLFVSINGYSPQAITGLNGKGSLRFVCIDGVHLLRSTEYGWSLPKLLQIVWRHADETGEAYLPVSSPRFIAMAD
jgi:hypothetical protein